MDRQVRNLPLRGSAGGALALLGGAYQSGTGSQARLYAPPFEIFYLTITFSLWLVDKSGQPL